VLVELDQVAAQAQTERYAVLYLRSGEKLLVEESLAEIQDAARFTELQRELRKRFKREIRDHKNAGISIDQAFAALWEEISAEVTLPESELARLYEDLLTWTKRWLK